MSIVKITSPKTGITYVYEQTAIWNKEKKQARPKRKLIGKLDENGNVVPTGGKGRPRKNPVPTPDDNAIVATLKKEVADLSEALSLAEGKIIMLENELKLLKEEKTTTIVTVEALLRKLKD